MTYKDELEASIKQLCVNRLVLDPGTVFAKLSTSPQASRIVIGVSASVTLFASSRMIKGASVTAKVNYARAGVALDQAIPEEQHGSPSHSIAIDESGTASTQNGDTSKMWIKYGLEKDNSSLVDELKSYQKGPIKVEQKIQKVPTVLRARNKCYDPMIIAIGPYHHGDEKLKQMKNFKSQFTLEYVQQSEKSIDELYEKMEKSLIDAKSYYAKEVVDAFNNKDFVDMMFLDSCFVIQFMYSCVEPEIDIRARYFETHLIMQDIMLLENQLPFKILIELMSWSSRFERDEGEKMIDNFIKLIMNNTCTEESSKANKKPIHLLELVQTKFVKNKEIRSGKSEKPSSNLCLYRSVKELKSVGVHFQASKSRRLSDITFKSMHLYGKLKLPQITIDDGTKSLLLNLVAFETCVDTQSNFGISSYIYFMDTLIDHPEDVKELRSKGIILNLLGSDEQVANLFNEISEHLVADFQVFGVVKNSLNAFYGSHPRRWLAEFLHNHFRNPWVIIAFFVAIIILSLTIIQTVFSAIQL